MLGTDVLGWPNSFGDKAVSQASPYPDNKITDQFAWI